MKIFSLLILSLTISLHIFSQSSKPPHLITSGSATQLVVKDKPFLALAGELRNSTVSTPQYMRNVWLQLKQKNVNTVLSPVYWELIEPQEGNFDFALVDSMILGARKQDLHLIILWFGTWKNGYSVYTPPWIKRNTDKYIRAKNKKGESVGVISAFSQPTLTADAKAFKTLMSHIRQVDEKYQTVVMAQIENEVGRIGEPRDYNEEANKAFEAGVPPDLMQYLSTNRGKLHPEIDSIWKANGYKTSGSWDEVFGKSILDEKNSNVLSYLPEEMFTVYNYSKYMGQVAAAGKAAYPIPLYVNAWLKYPGWMGYPGKYPSGGPQSHTFDIWRANAPAIDIYSPDVYAPGQGALVAMEQYHKAGNPLFVPEFNHTAEAANQAFWAYGKHDAVCFSPFGIDDFSPENDPFTKTYGALSNLNDLILQHQGKGTMMGIFVDTLSQPQTFTLNGYSVKAEVSDARDGFAPMPKKAAMAGGIVFSVGTDEFLAVGKDFLLNFTPINVDAQKPHIEVEYMEEGSFKNGKWVTTRRLNGDESTGGYDFFGNVTVANYGRLYFQKKPDDDYSIIRIKFYKF